MTARPAKNKKSQEEEKPIKKTESLKRKATKASETKKGNLVIVKDETDKEIISKKPTVETAEDKQKRTEEKYREDVNYILSVSNEKFDSISYKWKVIIIVSLVVLLILITFFRLRSLADGFRQSADTVTNVQNNVKGYTVDPNRTANELITQIRNAAAAAQSQNAANDIAKSVDPFDLANSTFVIDGETVKFSSGAGKLGEKTAAVEKMMYKGDFNEDKKDDIACILSVKDGDSITWYLAAILDGETRTVLPAKKIGTDYPIVTGIMGGKKSNEVFVAETAWKEQQTKMRTFSITEEKIKEI